MVLLSVLVGSFSDVLCSVYCVACCSVPVKSADSQEKQKNMEEEAFKKGSVIGLGQYSQYRYSIDTDIN